MGETINVTVWNEYRHEKEHEEVRKLYPHGIHRVIADYLNSQEGIKADTATLDEPEHGLTEEVLSRTDVLIWWGHMAHDQVEDAVVDRVQKRVLEGMGLIVLHSGHFSKIFRRILGTNCSLKWREEAEKERLWNLAPTHPITRGIGEYIELPNTEMYGERFDIPEPDRLIFVSWFEGGEVFRSGCVWERGHGRIFYFRPGHETYPIFYNEQIMTVITNAARWAHTGMTLPDNCPNSKPLEKLSPKSVDFGSAGVVQSREDIG
ncbi:MAG: ThuA domain-containing protein [Spirochaetales bacterium]|nr:ThuA domain-containing protein [Spirochaetales bacterium]